jgi:hypothetical protein
MKPLRELRMQLDFNPHEVTSFAKYFKSQNIDWNVFLKSKGKNLQRDLVWTIEQKRELINSILIGRHIPHLAIINTISEDGNGELWHIIDGKQRLSTLFDFMEDKFTIILEGNEYLFSELPNDYQTGINSFPLRYYVVNEYYDKKITDEQKIQWFMFINYAGTPQDLEHLESLNS